jgi:hypothetical protein
MLASTLAHDKDFKNTTIKGQRKNSKRKFQANDKISAADALHHSSLFCLSLLAGPGIS